MSGKKTSSVAPVAFAALLALWGIFMSSRADHPTPTTGAEKPSIEQQEIYVSIWRTAVDTQMHFNEMSVKARQFGLTFVAAALGLGVVLMSRGQEFSLSVSYFGGFEIRPELTNWPSGKHNGTNHERHAAFLKVCGGARSAFNPAVFSDTLFAASQM